MVRAQAGPVVGDCPSDLAREGEPDRLGVNLAEAKADQAGWEATRGPRGPGSLSPRLDPAPEGHLKPQDA